MRVLKTTQSSFENFVDDAYRSLPDTADRVFRYVLQFNSQFTTVLFNGFVSFPLRSTNITSSWQYTGHKGIDFDGTWNSVKEIILENFGGDLIDGVPSPSVQNTIYLAQRHVLRTIPEVCVFVFPRFGDIMCIFLIYNLTVNRSPPSTLRCPIFTTSPSTRPSIRNSISALVPTRRSSIPSINRAASFTHN